MRYFICLLMCLFCPVPLLLSGCGSGTLDNNIAGEVEEKVDTIKTSDQLYQEILPSLALLQGALAVPGKPLESTITDNNRRQVVSEVQQAVIRLSDEPNGQNALKQLGYDIQEIAKKARDQEKWHLVLACIDAFEVLSMDSYLLEKLDERAKAVLERPKVEVQGYFNDQGTGDMFVFLKLTNRLTQEVTKERVREGEEIQNLKVLEIIGNNRGVKLEFTKIEGLQFTVGNFGKELPEKYKEE